MVPSSEKGENTLQERLLASFYFKQSRSILTLSEFFLFPPSNYMASPFSHTTNEPSFIPLYCSSPLSPSGHQNQLFPLPKHFLHMSSL